MLSLHRGHALDTGTHAGQGGQRTDGAQPVEHQFERAVATERFGFEPALQCAQEGARTEIALAILTRGAAVGDRTQGLGNGMRGAPGQAHQVAAHRHQAQHRLGDVGFVQHRSAGQQQVQQQAAGQHIAFRGFALRTQGVGFDQHRLIDTAPDTIGGCWRSLGAGSGQSHQLHVACVVDQQAMQLKIVMGGTGLVGKGKRFQHLTDPAHRFDRRRLGMESQPFAQRDTLRSVDGCIRPVFLDGNLDALRQVRVNEACRMAHWHEPALECRRVDRLHSRQREHQFLLEMRILDQPHHAALALAQQLKQLETAEVATQLARSCAGGGRGIAGHGQGYRMLSIGNGPRQAPSDEFTGVCRAFDSPGLVFSSFGPAAGWTQAAGEPPQSSSTTAPRPVMKAAFTMACGCRRETARW